MSVQRWEIKIGAPVEARDGPVGRVQQVVLNPGNKRVTALVVRQGMLFGQDIVVPIKAVEDATDKLIRLHLSSDQLQSQPAHYLPFITAFNGYGPGQVVLSLLGQSHDDTRAGQGVSGEPGAIIRTGQRVECRDGDAGKVNLILLDGRTERATHFVVRQGVLRSRDIIVPIEWVSEFHTDHLKLVVDRAALDPLPEYLPDKEIKNRIAQALWKDDLIRRAVLTYTPIEIVVQDGLATLRGHVNTNGERQRAEDIVQEVRGVQGLENRLVIDYEVEVAVAQALGRDPRMRNYIVKVSSRFGRVFLQGRVPTLEVQTAAEEVAATVPQVRNVINRLRMSRRPAAKTALRIVEPRIGQEVYAVNVQIGKVYQVVISPRSRRVSAVIVRGKLPDPQQAKLRQLPDTWPQQERTVVVPAEGVDFLTTTVFLTLTALECAQLPDFNPADFVTPDAAWEPPFPYHREAVLLDLDRSSGAHFEASWSDVVLAERDQPEALSGQPGTLLPIRRDQALRYQRDELEAVDHMLVKPSSGISRARQSGRIEARSASFRK